MKLLFTVGALLGGLAVAFGAFGAHTLKDVLQANQLQTFETGVRYQFYHVFAILICAMLGAKYGPEGFLLSGWMFAIGILFFSGSLYLLACKEVLNLGTAARFIGPITPIGGLVFIAGWILLSRSAFKVL